MSPTDSLYWYKAHVVAVYDADTFTVDIDLGFGLVHHGIKVRAYGINAPEVRGVERPEGLRVRDYVRGLILDRDVLIRTFVDSKARERSGKYGRLLAQVVVETDDGWVNIGQDLIVSGMAVEATYGDAAPVWATVG